MISTLSDALAERGYTDLTAVQEAVTAPELQDADLLVSAQTGSGKTVGFGLAIAKTLLGDSDQMGRAAAPLALVIAPTRELAFQVMRELSWLYAKTGARVTSCVGGMDAREERRALERGAHIVVGTPGRLRDHITRGSLDMSDLRAIVLDEADEMLDLGFREDLEFMLGEAPEDRRTLMFSATVPPMIATLAKQYQRDAVRVTTLSGTSQHADITYQALRVAQSDAENAIINVLRYHEAQNAIVFANTRAAVNRLMARFSNRGFSVVCLSGELSQTERSHALQAMRDGRARVCVATDVAARGIDLPNLELVIHADLPSNSETLLHRSGRTGRAGRKGISALIVPPRSAKKAERLLKFAKITAEWTTAPDADEILRRDEERLLADPVWQEETTQEQRDFATKLLDLHSAETIAAAYLRLYRARQSAPEELSDPETRPAPRERAPFGPSAWVSLSVGRNDRAEARWLLPLICRAGNVSKDAIGAIRVQDSETFVELAEPSLAGVIAAIGDGGELENGITLRRVEGTPDLGPQRREPPRGRDDRGRDDRGGHRGQDRGPRRDDTRKPRTWPREDRGSDDRAPAPTPASDAPTATSDWSPDSPSPRKPRHKAGDAPRPAMSDSRPAPKYGAGKPRDRDDRKRDGYEGRSEGRGERKFGGKPEGKFGGKPGGKFGGKPGGKFGKPDGRPDSRGEGKPGGKPAGKFGDKPARANAADPSQRMSRPGKPGAPAKFGKPGGPKGKPGGKPAGPKHSYRKDGGGEPPRR